MTVCLETTIQRWNGQSGDMVTITDASEGSTFHAVDTGAKYIFHDSGWVEDLRLIYALTHV
jgi:nicotinamidase-related amidase